MSAPAGGRRPRRTPLAGLRAALALFTALPVPRSWHAAHPAGSAWPALLWLPAVGAGLGAAAGGLAAAVTARPGTGLLGGVVAVAVLALLTRALHLDGLADTADGLGSRAEPQRAREIMRRSDIGPFGVIALVTVLLADAAATSVLAAGGAVRVVLALAVAAGSARVPVLLAAGAPGAPGSRFGVLVGGACARRTAVATGGWVAVALVAGSVAGRTAGAGWVAWPLAQLAVLAVVDGWRRHVGRRVGGMSGDVFGALIETATALLLVALALAQPG